VTESLRSVARPRARTAPRRVVALGGGTGLPAVLRGLKAFVARGEIESLTAVVTMTDDGGSSGGCAARWACLLRETSGTAWSRSRRTRASSRGCSSTATRAPTSWAATPSEPDPNRAGGAGRQLHEGGRALGPRLRTAGRILPVTLDDARIEAILEDGSRLVGESEIAGSGRKIRRVLLEPRDAKPTRGRRGALRGGPRRARAGSLYTSIVPTSRCGRSERRCDGPARS